MNLKKTILIIIAIFIVPAFAFAGKAYYIDCSVSNNGDGSYSKPWNNFSSVNDHYWRGLFNTGDDVYLKAGTICKTKTELNINWDGTASDKVMVGAYSGKGKFNLGGKSRPVIDGQNRAPGDWSGLINKTNGGGHVIVENLEIKNSTGHAIQFSGADDITVRNCRTYRTLRSGITLAYANTGSIENNIVDSASWGMKIGASLQVTAGWKDGAAKNIKVKGNTVSNGYEGIGLYKKASYNLVENNVVYGNRSYQIYNGSGSHHNVIRNNTVYSREDDPSPPRAIVVGCEKAECGHISVCADDNEVYNNRVHGDIAVVGNCPAYPIRGNEVYGNTDYDFNGDYSDNTNPDQEDSNDSNPDSSTCTLDDRFMETTLNEGARYYADRRTNILTDVPPVYMGLDMIATPNDDRFLDSDSYLSFEIASGMTIYVGYDSRATSLPKWLRNFTDTGDRIYTSHPSQPYLEVYRKWFPAGTCIELGANRASGFSGGRRVANYIVFY